MLTAPLVGRDYPGTLGEFAAWFRTDADCLDYLRWLRWPQGFRCPACGAEGWLASDGRYECSERDCRCRTSVTAGTIFERTRTPLTVWFQAAWLFATSKDGVSAMALQRQLAIGSYQTAWTMLTKLRVAAGGHDLDRLSGEVEVDETLYGGFTPGQRGRTPGAKLLVAIAVERLPGGGFGRCRMATLKNARHPELRRFLLSCVEPGSTVITDGWDPYVKACQGLYTHQPQVAPGSLAAVHLPGVHRIASLFKRWMLGTHQGSAGWDHVALYLDEFVFRFNRRRSRHRGLVFLRLLERCVDVGPAPYHELIVYRRPKLIPPTPPPPGARSRTPTLERPREQRPWRG